MIDVHCHCLPGIDDGPESWELAEELCRRSAADGCEHIIATPHQRLGEWWNCDPQILSGLRSELQNRLGSLVTLYPGAEVRIDRELLDSLAHADRGGILTLAETEHILLEYPRQGLISDPEELVHEVKLQGLTPIFAHPELIPGLREDLPLMARLVAAGALFQVTTMSILGDFGRRTRLAAEHMLSAGLVHFVASDAHDLRYRPPGLSAAADKISEQWGSQTAFELTHQNAARLLSVDSPDASERHESSALQAN